MEEEDVSKVNMNQENEEIKTKILKQLKFKRINRINAMADSQQI